MKTEKFGSGRLGEGGSCHLHGFCLQSHRRARPAGIGVDFTNERGGHRRSQRVFGMGMKNQMRFITKQLAGVLAVGAFLAAGIASHGQGLTLDFSANSDASIEFQGTNNAFNFNAGANGYQWVVTGEDGGSSAIGLNSSVTNGPFFYGPVTTASSGGFLIEYATVLGPLGTLVVNDGTQNLTGTVNWIDVATYGMAGGALNAAVDVNVSDIQYAGTNPDLATLVADQPGSMDVSFQFAVNESLSQLSTGAGPYDTSFSGSISVTPEPSILALAGLGGLALFYLRRRK